MMKELNYRCPQCEHVLQVDEELVGQAIACPACSQPVRFEVEKAIPIREPKDLDPVHHLTAESKGGSPPSFETDLDVRHPAMFRMHPGRWLLVAGVGALGIAGAVYAYGEGTEWGMYTGIAVAVIAAAYFLYWWIAVRHRELRVTTQRTVYTEGIISRDSSEVRHDDVRNMQIDQTAPERIVGVGSIAISSAGQDGLEIVAKGIPNPDEVADMIRSRQKTS